MPVIAAICPSCNEIRARTGDIPRGTHPRATDFEPLGGQEPPVDGTLATCTICRTGLIFRTLPPAATNGADRPLGAGTASGAEQPSVVTQQVTSVSPVVLPLFQLADGEDVRFLREIGRDRVAVVTNKRGFVLDLARLAEEAP